MNQTLHYPTGHTPAKNHKQEAEAHHGIRHFFNERMHAWNEYRRATRLNRQKINERNNELRQELRGAGLTTRDMLKPDTFNLADVLFYDEHILAAVCGRSEAGVSTLILLTNFRLVCVNQIPLFIDADELTYSAVSGVSFDMGSWSSTIVLHTSMGDFTIRTKNIDAAKKFVEYVERAAIEDSAKNLPIKIKESHIPLEV